MSFTQVLEELPNLNVDERQLLVLRAIELDEPPLTDADEALIESRFARHHADPDSSISLEESKARIRGSIFQFERLPRMQHFLYLRPDPHEQG
jgi:putative addiction module component (TIGR02574 family)